MKTKWHFTADLHLDHPYLAKIRGFSYVTKMDKHIVEQWNLFVRPCDVVVVLGDVFWTGNIGYVTEYLTKLRGNKIFVKGNHDYWMKKAKINFRRIYQRKIGDYYFVCCHYPMWSWNRQQYGAIHLHGHSHAQTLPRVNMLDVGVDSAKIILGEYRPFSMEEVLYLTNTTKQEERY